MVEPICFKCGKRMSAKTNGVVAEEMMTISDNEGNKSEQPYKLWSADLWECKECGQQVLVGFAQQPIFESFKKNKYEEVRNKIKTQIFQFK